MPLYTYKALSTTGEKKTGILDAETQRDARVRLRKQNVHVIQMKELKKRVRMRFSLPRIFSRKRLEDLAISTRQLATLLAAGIPLANALTALIEQIEGEKMEPIFRDIKEKVTQGSSLAEAMAHYPKIFNDLYVNMIKAGEASGTLDGVLKRLADYIQKQNRLRNRISAALAYPMIMIIVGITVVTVLMTFVVPEITGILTAMGRNLPLVTQILIGTSDFFKNYWMVLVLLVFLLFFVSRLFYSTTRGRYFFDAFILKIPIFGPLFKKQAVSRFAITFSTLLKSGIPALESLVIVKNIVNNMVLANTLERVHTHIMEGTDISTPIKHSGVFPPVVGYMIAIGEQSGRLEEILDKISESYDEELEIATQKLTALLEPIIIVVLSVFVGFIILSILLPILEIGTIGG